MHFRALITSFRQFPFGPTDLPFVIRPLYKDIADHCTRHRQGLPPTSACSAKQPVNWRDRLCIQGSPSPKAFIDLSDLTLRRLRCQRYAISQCHLPNLSPRVPRLTPILGSGLDKLISLSALCKNQAPWAMFLPTRSSHPKGQEKGYSRHASPKSRDPTQHLVSVFADDTENAQ